MSRKVCVTAEGNTGFLIAELLLTNHKFNSEVDSVVGLTIHPGVVKAKELGQLSANVVPHKSGSMRETVKMLKETGADNYYLTSSAGSQRKVRYLRRARQCGKEGERPERLVNQFCRL
jgi:hypothetical protein